jgi:hypothetical protein
MSANGMRVLFLLSLALGYILGKKTVPKGASPAAKKMARS